jgi:hypothetical protein
MQKIPNGREGNKSLFPGFPIEKISEFSDTSEYPLPVLPRKKKVKSSNAEQA